jgi:hypothetical protein
MKRFINLFMRIKQRVSFIQESARSIEAYRKRSGYGIKANTDLKKTGLRLAPT